MTGPAAPTWRASLDAIATWRVLTVRPPWSWAIAFGGKTIENRTQAWTYRGPLLIHAGAGWSRRGADSPLVRAAWHDDDPANPIPWGSPPLPKPERLTPTILAPSSYLGPDHDPTRVIWHGAMVAVADLVDIHAAGSCADPGGPCHPWGETSYTEAGGRSRTDVVHLVLDDVLGLPDGPPASGRLGLWSPERWLDPTTIDDVRDAITHTLAHPPIHTPKDPR